MAQPTSMILKISSLFLVIWGLLSNFALKMQGANWLPWLALMLLMLLEAYSFDARPATWARWSAGLTKLIGPGMLPYYSALILSLSIGPSLMNHGERPIPRVNASTSPQTSSLPVRPPFPSGTPSTISTPQAVRSQPLPGSKFPRPAPVPQSATPSSGAPIKVGQAGKPPATNTTPLTPPTAQAKAIASPKPANSAPISQSPPKAAIAPTVPAPPPTTTK